MKNGERESNTRFSLLHSHFFFFLRGQFDVTNYVQSLLGSQSEITVKLLRSHAERSCFFFVRRHSDGGANDDVQEL
jgi:hypothetical protein